jgi:hypothetical protein
MATQKTFLLQLKSTIDKMGVDIAAQLEMTQFLDVDDREDYVSKIIEGKEDALIWRIISFDPHNHDKLYKLLFIVGVSIHADTNNTKALQSAGVIADIFKKGCSYDINDYAVALGMPTPKVGTISILTNGVDESINTGIQGFKFVTVRAMVAQLPI